MARLPMVTRTIVTTRANVLCLDVTSGEPFNEVFTLPRTFSDDKSLIKKIKDVYETDTVKCVHVVDKEEIETLYGMVETEFIKVASVLDPKTRKAMATEDTNEEA